MKGAVTLFHVASAVSWLASYRISFAYKTTRRVLFNFERRSTCRTSPSAMLRSDEWRARRVGEKTGARTPEVFGHRERSVMIGERRWPRCIPRIPRDPPPHSRSLARACSFVCTGCTTATRRPPSRECAHVSNIVPFNCYHNSENLTTDISKVPVVKLNSALHCFSRLRNSTFITYVTIAISYLMRSYMRFVL